ncbi:hypothetical protein GCM10009125_27730 [Castellaniella daejeonensis]|uniref:Prepilin type IV endopeptidase peptidase domain-containing protein n=1 Tax=Castellaniella daejeonensis TaxID=659013 RepID=A0ABP3DS85_9BURK
MVFMDQSLVHPEVRVFVSVWLNGILPVAAGAALAALTWPLARRQAFVLGADPDSIPHETGFQPRRGFCVLLGSALGGLCVNFFAPGVQMWAALMLGLILFVLAWIDLDTRLLPNFLTIPLWMAGLLFSVLDVFASPLQAVLGSAAAWFIFWLAGALYRLLHGRTGLGGGDIKLAAALGAWLGWPQVPSLLLLTATLSLASWGLMAACGRTSRMQPLGPSLALGGLLVLLMSA